MTRVIGFKSPCPIALENFSRSLPDIHPAAGTRPLAKAKTRFNSTSGSRDSCSSSSLCSSDLTTVPSARCDYPMLPDRGQETAAQMNGVLCHRPGPLHAGHPKLQSRCLTWPLHARTRAAKASMRSEAGLSGPSRLSGLSRWQDRKGLPKDQMNHMDQIDRTDLNDR